jgi:hypothetical protein
VSQLPQPNPPNPVPVPPGTGDPLSTSAAAVIEFAMRNCLLIDKLEQPDSDDYRQYMPRLNGLINFEQTQGLKLWLQENISFTPVVGQQAYAWGPTGDITMPRPTRIIEGFFTFPVGAVGNAIATDAGILIQTDSGQQLITSQGASYNPPSVLVRYPLQQLSRNEFNNLGVLNVSGITNSFFVDKQQQNLIVWLWLNPDAFVARSLVTFVTQVQVNQAISITDSMNFPIEWFNFLHWALACEIDQGQPASVQAKDEAMCDFYRTALENFDVEDTSTYLTPDTRVGFSTGRFA